MIVRVFVLNSKMLSKNAYFELPQVSGSELEILVHQYPELFSGHHVVGSSSGAQGGGLQVNPDFGNPTSMANNTFHTKPTGKKDRHSKIFTSQGPRDRRVRLSIDIARKFFDLQEMLGFDKPSKTLDWLLTKSRTAIQDLQDKTKQNGSGSECDVDEVGSYEGNGTESIENGNSKAQKSGYKGSRGSKEAQPSPNHAKDSRAKARARARERTREKMCIKQLHGSIPDSNPSIPNQYNGDNTRFEDFQLSAGSSTSNLYSTFANAALCDPTIRDDLIHESTNAIRRKSTTKNHSYSGFPDQDYLSLSSSYNTPSADQNWDHICNFTSQSNLCTIWDHHKFINSTSNQ